MTYFFTLLDDSLRPRGSRDPLGLEMVWAGVGRRMVGNLTTVTAHLDNFIFALLGFHLSSNKNGTPEWELFQRFEQVTGYARAQLEKADGLLGRRRIQKLKDSAQVPFGDGPAASILENQRQAGMWGLYSSALEASGLIARERCLTADGREIVERLLRDGDLPWLPKIFDQKNRQLAQADFAQIRESVTRILRQRKARKQLAEKLLSGGAKAPGMQAELYEQACAFVASSSRSSSARRFLAKLQTGSGPLQDYAQRVEQLDHVCIFANVVFFGLLGCHGKSKRSIADEQVAALANWPGMCELVLPDFPEVNGGEWKERARRLRRFAEACAQGDYIGAIETLVKHHEAIVHMRGGAPWCHWENDVLKVVSNGSAQAWPASEDLMERFQAWAEPRTMDFFLGSFLSILQQSSIVRDQDDEVAA